MPINPALKPFVRQQLQEILGGDLVTDETVDFILTFENETDMRDTLMNFVVEDRGTSLRVANFVQDLFIRNAAAIHAAQQKMEAAQQSKVEEEINKFDEACFRVLRDGMC